MNGSIKKAVILYAAQGKGKTPTLKRVIDILRLNGDSLFEEARGAVDMIACFRVGGRIVGVATGGDNAEIVNQNLADFEAHGCEVIVVASRKYSNHESWVALDAYFQSHGVDSTCQFEKEYENDVTLQDAVNLRQACLLVTNI